jgi:hypothetical protein
MQETQSKGSGRYGHAHIINWGFVTLKPYLVAYDVLEVGAGANKNWSTTFCDLFSRLLLCPAFEDNREFFSYALRYAMAVRTDTEKPSDDDLVRCLPVTSYMLDTVLDDWEESTEAIAVGEVVTLDTIAAVKTEMKEAFHARLEHSFE